MIVRCPECGSQYDVHPASPLEPGIKVRCPGCRAVFPMSPEEAGEGLLPPARSRARITDPALARRMARAMLSEILLNRRGEREEALLEGTLLSRFGTAIVAAYQVYGEKVSREMPAQRRIFREAVNDILGGGVTLL